MSSYTSDEHRTMCLTSSKKYYHTNGKFRKGVAYYLKKNPDIDPTEFFAGIDDWDKKYDKIVRYHNQLKVEKVKEMFLNRQTAE